MHVLKLFFASVKQEVFTVLLEISELSLYFHYEFQIFLELKLINRLSLPYFAEKESFQRISNFSL